MRSYNRVAAFGCFVTHVTRRFFELTRNTDGTAELALHEWPHGTADRHVVAALQGVS
jgi:hypothetical protein